MRPGGRSTSLGVGGKAATDPDCRRLRQPSDVRLQAGPPGWEAGSVLGRSLCVPAAFGAPAEGPDGPGAGGFGEAGQAGQARPEDLGCLTDPPCAQPTAVRRCSRSATSTPARSR